MMKIAEGKDSEVVAMFAELDESFPDAEFSEMISDCYGWSAKETASKGEWKSSSAILARALATKPNDSKLNDRIQYLTQESLKAIDDGKNPKAAAEWIDHLRTTFPNVAGVSEALGWHVLKICRDHASQQEYAEAREALAQRSTWLNEEQRQNYAVEIFDSEGKEFLRVENWDKAIETYQKGLKECPDSGLLKQNLEYSQSKKAAQ